jgi:AraC-like DNA-binding protein
MVRSTIEIRYFGRYVFIVEGGHHTMTWNKLFTVNPGWRILLTDLGISPANVLRLAGLPGDLFNRENAALSTDEYFRLWHAMEMEADDPLLAVKIGRAISVEAFDPPVFAALCSPNLNIALRRISRYKRLIMPMALHVKETGYSTSLELQWLDATIDQPPSLVTAELVFFVQLARIATRETIRPLEIISPFPPSPAAKYNEFFGVEVSAGKKPTVIFAAIDAKKPFLTTNNAMWKSFEPGLRKQLSELDNSATMSERVRAALLELLPSGSATINSAAAKLGVSPRTLQRRLKEEDDSFQAALNGTREKLALHYLKNPALSGAEISFLLGYEEPGSFFRAFHSWTGKTPNSFRIAPGKNI